MRIWIRSAHVNGFGVGSLGDAIVYTGLELLTSSGVMKVGTLQDTHKWPESPF